MTFNLEEYKKKAKLRYQKNVKEDPQKTLRLKSLHCKKCYYSIYLVGNAFTKYSCNYCKEDYNHPNTNTPKLCLDCAKLNNLCRDCEVPID